LPRLVEILKAQGCNLVRPITNLHINRYNYLAQDLKAVAVAKLPRRVAAQAKEIILSNALKQAINAVLPFNLAQNRHEV